MAGQSDHGVVRLEVHCFSCKRITTVLGAHIPTLKWVFFHLVYTFHCARQYLNGSQATVDGIRFYWGKVMHDMKLYIYIHDVNESIVSYCVYIHVL